MQFPVTFYNAGTTPKVTPEQLLPTQRGGRIDTNSTPRRTNSGQRGRYDQDNGNDRERDRIQRLDAEEHGGKQSAENARETESDTGSDHNHADGPRRTVSIRFLFGHLTIGV